MTTIAYDGTEISSDSQCDGAYIMTGVKKVEKIGKSYFGTAGRLEDMYAFLDWRRGGEKPKVDEYFESIEIRGKQVYWWGQALVPCKMPYPAAIGSGAQFAMGAMLAGATAKEAVKIASKLDSGTGSRIRSITVRKKC